MIRNESFIRATVEYNTFEAPVPAYYFRGGWVTESQSPVTIRVAACGFYELFFNGERITRGLLSPYISNPDHYVYYDEYTVTPRAGKNVVGLLLGNGFQNNPGGHIWEFDRASFRSAPCLAVSVTQGDSEVLNSASGFRVAPSAIRADDYRFGEVYDANFAIDGWNLPELDDSAWAPALPAPAPKGILRPADVAPIVKECELRPVSIVPCGDGYLYDFGQSNAGVCRLRIQGTKGQRVELRHADSLSGGDLNLAQVWFVREHWERDREIVHRDVYVCRGEGVEEYQPTFTYHGFRYVKVTGITPAQATPDLLTYLVYHTDLHPRGDFLCSDPIASQLQVMTRRSILSNFHHYPTDCPQREKNGWTADAALTSEAALMNFDPERNYREWMRNICKAQKENGSLPGIVPTGGWGFDWGNGPAWDSVLIYLPYYSYRYRGETAVIRESAPSISAYLRYLRTRVDEKGLLSIGLGDWCPVGGGKPKAPLILTDSIMALDLCTKSAELFHAIGNEAEETFARAEAKAYRASIRANLVEFLSLRAAGNCQSSQAMCLYYGVFDPAEELQAFDVLLEMVHACDDHMDVGVLGGRVLFHVLSRFGQSELAFRMITRLDYPSYGNWIARGATTLWENFHPTGVNSQNHHFWGDISAWFMQWILGIRLNPTLHDLSNLILAPVFLSSLTFAQGYHDAPWGRISVAWVRKGEDILLTVDLPEDHSASLCPEGYVFEDGSTQRTVSGKHQFLLHPKKN
ncbi:MAG: family 78 glycoside hydrolase catalytic domain [Clostridia bacterium]|nr:family 78 glycoside hydrolase catalytic domain [Clostridia bacterium]